VVESPAPFLLIGEHRVWLTLFFGRKKTGEDMKTCFGNIYPDLEHFQFGKPMVGKVFQMCVETLGAGHRERKMEIDIGAWQDCQRCEDFRNCFDFSSAKLQMQVVLTQV
jgi:sulfatase maturation enzyme AslB (radical SAM superfamily)